MIASLSKQLCRADRRLRDECILKVREGLGHVQAVAEALLELREGRLYRETHRTFEAFCRDTFGLTRQAVNMKIAAQDVIRSLEAGQGEASVGADRQNGKPGFPFLPNTESQINELASVPNDRRSEVWQASIKAAGGKQPTKRVVRKVVGEALGRPSAQPKPAAELAQMNIRKALGFLRSIPSPTKNINAAIDLLTRELDYGVATSNNERLEANES